MLQLNTLQQASLRHCAYYLGQLSRASALYEQGGEFVQTALNLLDQIWLQSVQAHSWAIKNTQEPQALDMITAYPLAVRELLFLRQPYEVKVAWAEFGLDAARRLKRPIDAVQHLIFLGRCHLLHGDAQTARRAYAEALSLAQAHDDALGEAQALLGIARIDSLISANFEQVRAQYQKALAIFEAHEDTRNIAWTLMNLGNIEERFGDLDEAESYIQRSLQVYQTMNELRGEANCWKRLASIAERRKDYGQAKRHLEEALKLSRRADDSLTICQCLLILGLVISLEGDLLPAGQIFEEAAEIARKYHYQSEEVIALVNLSWVANKIGHMEQAEAYQQTALAICRRLNRPSATINSLTTLGFLALRQKKYEAALAYSREGFLMAMEYRLEGHILELLVVYALWYWLMGDAHNACLLLTYVREHPLFSKIEVEEWLDGWEKQAEAALTTEERETVKMRAQHFDYEAWFGSAFTS